MAHRIDDRWLWLGVGAVAFLAVKGLQYALADLIHLTKIDPYQFEPKRKKEEYPEDTLSVADLKVLVESPRPNISEAAISLVLSRMARMPSAPHMLVQDLASKEPEVSRRAQQTIHFLRHYDTAPFDDRGLPLSYPGYASPVQWSGRWQWSDDDDEPISPLATLRDELIGGGESIVPSIEDPVAGWENVPRERGSGVVEEDGDDAEARRRRREAMVLHEGHGAVTQDEIIRPRETG